MYTWVWCTVSVLVQVQEYLLPYAVVELYVASSISFHWEAAHLLADFSIALATSISFHWEVTERFLPCFHCVLSLAFHMLLPLTPLYQKLSGRHLDLVTITFVEHILLCITVAWKFFTMPGALESSVPPLAPTTKLFCF